MSTIDRPSTIVLQSCDETYAPLLEASGPVNSTYAALHGYTYRSFVGFMSPTAGANFNRYHLIREELDVGRHDWAFWMDVDAIAIDLRFPLESLIERTPEKMLIACTGTDRGEFDINNGVFLMNLRHPLARELVEDVIRVGDSLGRAPNGFYSDQAIMQRWLQGYADEAGHISFLQCYAGSDRSLFNYDGRFIKHVLRTCGNGEQRLAKIRRLAELANHSWPMDEREICP
jgi:hypothetical protein